MAKKLDGVFFKLALLMIVLAMVGLILTGFILRLPMRLQLKEKTAHGLCPRCMCDCPSEDFAIPLDCGKHDHELKEELEKDVIALYDEELKLQKSVTNDTLEHTRALIKESKESSSRYQKEAEKCNAAIYSCEEARERAEAELEQELKLSALWEKRAREFGWKYDRKLLSS